MVLQSVALDPSESLNEFGHKTGFKKDFGWPWGQVHLIESPIVYQTLPFEVKIVVWFVPSLGQVPDLRVDLRPDQRTWVRNLKLDRWNHTGIWKPKFFFNFYYERMIHFFSFLIDFEKASRVQILSVLVFSNSLWSHIIRRDPLKLDSITVWLRPFDSDLVRTVMISLEASFPSEEDSKLVLEG